MKALGSLTGFCLLAAALAVALGSNAEAQVACQPGDTLVSISGFSYSPASVTVAPGTTVCWTNQDGVSHTVTSDTGAFDSGALSGSETFRHTFSSAGTFPYHCGVPGHAMNAEIVVTSTAPTADFDGDGDTDFSVWRPQTGTWYAFGGLTEQWGVSDDVPVPGQYDADAATDVAVWRPSSGFWYVKGGAAQQWGISSDVPVPGDYDGDGDTEFAVWRRADGTWYVHGGVTQQWGISTDIPVPGQYDADPATDIAVWRPSDGTWYVQGGVTQQWGISSDVPVPGDYDGDGDTEFAAWRPSSGFWYVHGGATQQWGISSDKPLPVPPAIARLLFP